MPAGSTSCSRRHWTGSVATRLMSRHCRLSFAGVPIVTLAEGEISELHVGLKAR